MVLNDNNVAVFRLIIILNVIVGQSSRLPKNCLIQYSGVKPTKVEWNKSNVTKALYSIFNDSKMTRRNKQSQRNSEIQ